MDDMEADWTKPIVSIRCDGMKGNDIIIIILVTEGMDVRVNPTRLSCATKLLAVLRGGKLGGGWLVVGFSIGCDAVFLLGEPSKEQAPVAMRLRSGDCVLMAREARQCHHGD